jgi:high frequency lysogenization protein
MNIKTLSNQVLALAGLYQACYQVKSLAWKGQCESDALDTAIGSVFKIDANNIQEIYGGGNKLNDGLRIVAAQFDPNAIDTDIELTRYAFNLFAIEKKLRKRSGLLPQLGHAIDQANTQLSHYGTNHPNTWSALAEIYQNTISTLTPRIMISGERLHLNNNTNVAKIRSLLLAAVRSAVLWRQCGGSRFNFLFNRRNYFHEANNLLA